MTLLERLRKAVAPRYTVDREIARGGMGIVFVGHDTQLERPVAIKLLTPELATEEFSRRFLHEAQLMAKVRHPNVARVVRNLVAADFTTAGQRRRILDRAGPAPPA
ncbi:MAG: protein kinase [Gemmatimonadales bacterium]